MSLVERNKGNRQKYYIHSITFHVYTNYFYPDFLMKGKKYL